MFNIVATVGADLFLYVGYGALGRGARWAVWPAGSLPLGPATWRYFDGGTPERSLKAGDEGRYPGRLSRVGYRKGERGLGYGSMGALPRRLDKDR